MTPLHPDTRGVTVVTAVLNGRATLERTLASVREQTWPDVEHVVVDGGSTDGTVDLLRAAAHVRWTSERDRGLYDAMNRGLAQVADPARYVVFLNADDTFHAPDAVANVMAASAGEDFVYGRLERWDDALDHRDLVGRPVRGRAMLYGMRAHHQAVFCRRAVFDRVGAFDLQYRLAADYDWAVRVFQRPDVTKRFVPVVVSTMRRGGLSDVRFLQSRAERWRIVKSHYGALDVLRFAVYTQFGDVGRYHLQQWLGRIGLLGRARALKLRLRGSGG